MRMRELIAVLGVVLVGCPSEPAPARVRLELPELVTNTDPLRPTIRAHRGNTSSSLVPGKYQLAADPTAVARANPDGTVQCLKSGDAKVTADVKGVTNGGTLRCRLVERVEVAELPVLDLKQGSVTLAARAFAKGGVELSDVPFSVASTNQGPVAIKGLEVTPLAIGTTDLVVRVGGVERRLATRVVRNVDVTPQPLHGGKRLDVALPAGKYELEVVFREPKELRIDWRGLRQCSYRKTSAAHRSTCTLAEKGGAAVDNPVFVESGETTIDKARIVVREVP